MFPMLLHRYRGDPPSLVGWYWSTKLDGVRAIWNGHEGMFYSRTEKPIYAPGWVKMKMPRNIILDGELYAGEGRFQECISIVRKVRPSDEEWKRITFQTFDVPCLSSGRSFTARLSYMRAAWYWNEFNQRIPQFILKSDDADIDDIYATAIANDYEGLVVTHPDCEYVIGPKRPYRTYMRLKIRAEFTANAAVKGYTAGEDKHEGRMGALIVLDIARKVTFKIGTGFTDEDRAQPPAVGSPIQYKYAMLTDDGIPKFTSFLRTKLDTNNRQPFDPRLCLTWNTATQSYI